MRVLCLYCALFLAVVVAACGGDEPVSVSEPQTQTQRASKPVAQQEAPGQSAAQASRRPGDVDRAAESEAEPAAADEPEDALPAEASTAEETAQVSEQPSPEAAPARTDDQAEEARPEPRQHPLDRTDVPAAVVQDADVRMRPGLAWPVMDRLESGASVAVLQHADGWYRIRFGGDLEGWIRTTMLDLGRVGQRQVLEKPAPPLIAEWRGEEHGVMGLSADGAEVRLLKIEDETSIIIGAPIDEVNLPAGDVTLQDLPILIGDETVIFPGDDFRVGQGKILPRANEWMWLPWGWLLAHNDTHIWQWRPETDELEFIARPPGFAKLSPDGRYLAIADLCARDLDCGRDNSVLIIPLDGTQRIAFVEDFRTLEVASSLGMTSSGWNANLKWSKNSKAVMLRVALFDRGQEPRSPTTLLFHDEGHMIRLDPFWSREFRGRACRVDPPFADGYFSTWEFHGDDTIAIAALCVDIKGDLDLHTLVFTFTGEFLRFEPFESGGSKDEDVARIRSVEGGDTLEEPIYIAWSPLRRHAMVVEESTGRAWLYSARQHDLRAVVV